MFKCVTLLVLIVFSCVAWAAFHDPTRPPNVTALAGVLGADLSIQGVVIEGSKKQVLVGGKYLNIGDEIAGAKIIAINHDGIKLQTRSGVISVSLFAPVKKQYVVSEGD
ncbi:MAG: hypothetical protein KAS93_06040 [Gammaproteobacteria bacterium]|nr:hypothetical protein [Gammaproteobacteria bacterium]